MKFSNIPLIGKLYKLVWYFETGKGQVARLYQWLPDIMNILTFSVVVLHYQFPKSTIIVIFAVLLLVFTLVGLFFKKTGLYDTDRYVQTDKDPVMREVLQAARHINARYKKR